MMRTDRRAEGLAALVLAALASAGLLALAMPGYLGWWPLLFVGLIPLVQICLKARPLRSAVGGFVFGLVYHLALLYWILIVLGRYGGLPLWISLLALCALAAYMACFSAVFCGLFSLLVGRSWRQQERSVAALVWIAPLLWVGLDSVRSVLFSGFPWMDLGYGLFAQPQLIQAADIGGHHLVSFSVVLTNSLVVALINRQQQQQGRAGCCNLRLEPWFLLLAVVFLVVVVGYSLVRYQRVLAMIPRALQAQVAVVQGNIDQATKWSPVTKAATVDTYVRLSGQARSDGAVDLVIWPETAVPFYPQRDALIKKVVDFVTTSDTWLLTGAPMYSVVQQPDGAELIRYWNSAILVGPGGRFGGQYDKQHLVPFGEYVPLRPYLPFLQPLVVNIDDFSAGTATKPLILGSMQLGILICYESIFPEIASASVMQGANLLVNITNDAWYGRSIAPYQSMAMAVFRAVENKRSLVRSANTGISGFVDPLGRITDQTEIFTEAALVAQVPLFDIQTVFHRNGSRFGLACAVLVVFLLVLSWYRSGRRERGRA